MRQFDVNKLLGFRIAHTESVIGAKNGSIKVQKSPAKLGAKNGISKPS